VVAVRVKGFRSADKEQIRRFEALGSDLESWLRSLQVKRSTLSLPV
jgi:hypothetical protein